jgi:hypothetical protein
MFFFLFFIFYFFVERKKEREKELTHDEPIYISQLIAERLKQKQRKKREKKAHIFLLNYPKFLMSPKCPN